MAEDEKFVPNYVIRGDDLGTDLGDLLEALGCTNDILVGNVHGVNGKDPVDVPLVQKDFLYRTMLAVAEKNNAAGLEAARTY